MRLLNSRTFTAAAAEQLVCSASPRDIHPAARLCPTWARGCARNVVGTLLIQNGGTLSTPLVARGGASAAVAENSVVLSTAEAL